MYQPNQMFGNYPQSYAQPYQDRLTQLQSQYQQALPNMPQTFQSNQGLLWVQGEAGAKAYMMAPGTTVLLMDSEAQRFYLKSTDSAGMPMLRTFEYSEVSQGASRALQTAQDNLDAKYVTRAEYDGLQGKFKNVMDKLEELQTTGKQRTTKAKEVNPDE